MEKDFIRVCPKCGGTKWKFPNTISPSSSMINGPSFVNNFCECEDCGHIGIFLEVDKDKIKEFQKEFKSKRV